MTYFDKSDLLDRKVYLKRENFIYFIFFTSIKDYCRQYSR